MKHFGGRCAEGRRKLGEKGGFSEETEYVDKQRAAAATQGEDIKKGRLGLCPYILKVRKSADSTFKSQKNCGKSA